MHTPGPWRIGKFESTVVSNHKVQVTHPNVKGDEGVNAPDYFGGNLIAESVLNKHNADLIATVPEMFDVLVQLIALEHDESSRIGDLINKAKAVVEKASGEAYKDLFKKFNVPANNEPIIKYGDRVYGGNKLNEMGFSFDIPAEINNKFSEMDKVNTLFKHPDGTFHVWHQYGNGYNAYVISFDVNMDKPDYLEVLAHRKNLSTIDFDFSVSDNKVIDERSFFFPSSED